jgi:hypothetical protein
MGRRPENKKILWISKDEIQALGQIVYNVKLYYKHWVLFKFTIIYTPVADWKPK